jgi:hypothetical protein
MTEAATEPCDDFPEPKDPVDLSSASSGYASDDDDDPSSSFDDDDTDSPTGDDLDGDGFPDNAYLPGTGDEEVPADNGGAGDQGGGNGPPGPAGNPNQGGGGTDDGGISP